MSRRAEVEQQGAERSYLTLAFEVMIHPRSAFDEIIRRRLLVQGLWIVAIAATTGMLNIIVGLYRKNGSTVFALAISTPLSAIGWALIGAWFIFLCARRLGGRGDYNVLLTVQAWSSVAVLLMNVASLLGPWFNLLGTAFMVWGLVIAIISVSKAMHISGWRSFLAILAFYLVFSVVFLGMFFAAKTLLVYNGPDAVAVSIAGLPFQVLATWVAAAALLAGSYCIRDGAKSLRGVFRVLGVGSVIIAINATALAAHARPFAELRDGVQAYEALQPVRGVAARHFEHLLRYYPGDKSLRLGHAHSLAEDGDFKAAEEAYRTIEPNSAIPGLGNALYGQGRYRQAIAEFNRYLSEVSSHRASPSSKSHNPQYPSVTSRVALVHLRLGDARVAEGEAERAIRNRDRSFLPHFVLAQAYALQGKPKASLASVQKVQEIAPSLAKRIEGESGGWRTAAGHLTPADLRMSLTAEAAGTGD